MKETEPAGFACPVCRERLSQASPSQLVCGGQARHHWRVEGGVPEFLTAAGDPEALRGNAGEWASWFALQEGRWQRQRARVWARMLEASVAAAPPPGSFVDIGAGSGGLAASASGLGYAAFALDVTPPPEGPYARGTAAMEALPFDTGTVRVAALCAALHYARELPSALREARRVLSPGGALVVGLTPLHETAKGAERGAAKTRRELTAAGASRAAVAGYHHLLRGELELELRAAGFSAMARPPGFGAALSISRALKAAIVGDAIARFPLYVAQPIA